MQRDNKCKICPRECEADRTTQCGFCGVNNSGEDKITVAKAMLHFGEEPVISGTKGSGAIFFSGCNMRCVFCQNYKISSGGLGREISLDQLADIIMKLQSREAHNINLVTATHYTDKIAKLLEKIKPSLNIPVVFNCGGYEKTEALRMLDGLVDIYLPDFKYYDEEISQKYSRAKDYFDTAYAALEEMIKQTGKYVIENGLMKKGVIVRHLILPGCYKDSINIFKRLADFKDDILISLMRQYFPSGRAKDFLEINRKLTTFEYCKVLSVCEELGFEGFTQEKGCDNCQMTPDFDLEKFLEI